jgi:hypothetical protein
MDTAAYEKRKWDVKVAIFFTLKSDFYLTKGDLISTREGFEN